MVPHELLQKSDKILFIAHLALGDFTYLQNCFRAFADAYPHIRIHLWVDELRRTARPADWEHLKSYSLYDWLAECPAIAKVYNQTYSPALLKQSMREAQQQAYPIVISLGLLRRNFYAGLARKISPQGFVAGQTKRARLLDIHKHLAYRKLDARIPDYGAKADGKEHISDIYAGWFELLFGLQIAAAARFPFVDIPERWRDYARDQLMQWQFPIDRADRQGRKIFFVNAFSKSVERNWPLERVLALIQAMRRQDRWRDSYFVINVVPEQMGRAQRLFDQNPIEHAHLFSAVDNFFQLPAILSLCDLIISVETAVMHLANAVHVPVVALMRLTSLEWVPIDQANSTIIHVSRPDAWVDSITVEDVMAVMLGQGSP
ncbi:glycosyltransferase family 9 protein [Undibacterium arcticum]|uniref:glycosyltransferase family 9 protein n=1 Tax=Undibacterium arcticum TaxID=1762892 RepID=UPI00360BDF14